MQEDSWSILQLSTLLESKSIYYPVPELMNQVSGYSKLLNAILIALVAVAAAVVAGSAEGGVPFPFKEHKSLALVWPKWPPLSFSSHFEVPFLLELMWLQPLERWHIQERAVKELYTLIETWGYVQVVTSENNAPMEYRSPWSNESVITIPGISDSIAEGKNASQRFLKSA